MAELVTTAPAPPWLLDRVGHVAQQKYDEAVTTAVESCAEDTKGQTCYICHQALHRHTKEGLVRGCACRGTAGFAHASCLAEQAKILFAEAEENNLDVEVKIERWNRWDTCSLCEQMYHSVVRCALGWACWKTYVGRPEADDTRFMAINQLGNGLYAGGYYADSLCVREAELAMMRRIGADEEDMLAIQNNLANTYAELGHLEKALSMVRDVYSGRLKLHGEEHEDTLGAAFNYAISLIQIERFEEAKAMLRKTIPVARRVFGESNEVTLNMRWNQAMALCEDDGATLDDLREAVTTLEESERTARRVFRGTRPEPRWLGAHPFVEQVEYFLRESRGLLHKKRKTEATPSPRNSTLS